MTIQELYLKCRRELKAAGVDSPEFDAAALVFHCFGLDRTALAVRGGQEAALEQERCFLRAAGERAEHRPLQYILGEWEFMGLSLKVGEGVLVPREDTETLVRACAERLSEQAAAVGPIGGVGPVGPTGLDLCAGSGAVALGLCSLLPGAEVTAWELSGDALPYLRENTARYPQHRISIREGDILNEALPAGFPGGTLDFIVSNPPYIASGELPGLQREVRREPRLALDGGADGLRFYRAIAQNWKPLLRPGGVLAVEIGETQAADIFSLFEHCGLRELRVHQDWAGLDRCVTGIA